MRKPDKGTLTFIFAKTWPIETSLRYSYDFRLGIANDKPRGRDENVYFMAVTQHRPPLLLLTREKIFFQEENNERGAHGEASNQIPLALTILQ